MSDIGLIKQNALLHTVNLKIFRTDRLNKKIGTELYILTYVYSKKSYWTQHTCFNDCNSPQDASGYPSFNVHQKVSCSVLNVRNTVKCGSVLVQFQFGELG